MDDNRSTSIRLKLMLVTLVILGLIIVVAYFARQKLTSWIQYASIDTDLSRIL
jgi:uncharacterized membrane protein